MGGALAVPFHRAAAMPHQPPLDTLPVAGGLRLGVLSIFDMSGRTDLPLSPLSSPGAVGVVLALEPAEVEQFGRSTTLASGEWTLYRPDRLAGLRRPARVLVVFCPRESLQECLACVHLDRFAADEPVNRVTFSVLTALCGDAERLPPGYGSELAHAALHVLKNAVLDRCGRRRARDPLLQRVKEAVEWRLRDPDLSVGALAQALNCTERSIHRAFKAEDETFSRYVLRRRLDRCRRDLMHPELAHQSVTEIALSHGFNSPAHFSRTYKEQFGCSPSAVRPLRPRQASGG